MSKNAKLVSKGTVVPQVIIEVTFPEVIVAT
jgi:hypothetical protein